MRPAILLGLLLGSLATSVSAEFVPDTLAVDEVREFALPAAVVAKAVAAAPRKDRPFHYATPITTDFSVAEGSWETLASGERRVRLVVSSAEARSLSLHFSPFELPPNARVWLYSTDGRTVHGPYRAAQATRLGLWTPVVHGDRIVVEARLPASEVDGLKLGIANAYHGYRDWKDSGDQRKSGACNNDVACFANGEWSDEIRSSARIQVEGSVLCSGQLVNNVEQNLDPLFLTADHCGIGETTRDSPAESVVFYWNYQASECNGAVRDGQLNAVTQSGSEFLADGPRADFTLLRLLAQPEAVANVYYAGWDASGEGGNSGVGIHHPSGDEKSISFFNSALQAVDADIDGSSVRAWRVQRWTSGTTEAGSSGSGLWNGAHRIVGVLTGGDAACSEPDGSDFYGRLNAGWNPANSRTDGQLRVHLDPTCSGRMAVPGLDPSTQASPLATGSGCDVGTGGGARRGGGGAMLLLGPLLLATARRTRSRA